MSCFNPVDTWRRFNVYNTSTGKDDVPCQNRVLLKTIFLTLLQNHQEIIHYGEW